MNSIRFQHADRSKTAQYRVDYFVPGTVDPAHSFLTSSVVQVAPATTTAPPTFEILSLSADQKPSVPGQYELTVTAVSAVGESTSERSMPYPTAQPPVAPLNVTVTY
jgi:hypothetical protein